MQIHLGHMHFIVHGTNASAQQNEIVLFSIECASKAASPIEMVRADQLGFGPTWHQATNETKKKKSSCMYQLV